VPLGSQRKAVILIGAQAIYFHTGAIELAVCRVYNGCDIALDPQHWTLYRKLDQR